MGGQGQKVHAAGDIRQLTPQQFKVAAAVVRSLTGREVGSAPELGARAVEVLLCRTFAGWADHDRVESARRTRFTNV
jgi:hypothetical protein